MSLVDRVKNILTTPKTEWPVIAGEEPDIKQVLIAYVLPLAMIPTVAMLIGYGLIGMGMLSGFTYGLSQALVALVGAFVGVFVSSYVIDMLAPNFGSEKNLGRSVQLVAYSYTPSWVAGVLNIVPALGMLAALAGLYGIFLMYLGLPHIKKTPQDKAVVYLVVSILVIIVVSVVVGMILAAIFGAIIGVGMMTGMR